MESGRYNRKKVSRSNLSQQIQFSLLRSEQLQCLKFQIHPQQKQTYTIKQSKNIIPIIMILSTYICKKKLKITDDIFQNIQMKNIPQKFQKYFHSHTLKDIFTIFQQKTLKVSQMSQIVSNFNIIQFLLNCLIRKILLDIIKNKKNIDLMGNQTSLLQDYQVQYRGNLLNLLSQYLQMEVIIKYSQYGQFQQNYGQEKSPIKIQIDILDEHCKWKVKDNLKQLKKIIKPQLFSVRSMKHMQYSQKRNTKNSYIDTSTQISSIDKVIRNSVKKINPQIYQKYESKLNFAKYISPKNSKLITSQSEYQTNIKVGYKRQKHKFCFLCRKVNCECQQ